VAVRVGVVSVAVAALAAVLLALPVAAGAHAKPRHRAHAAVVGGTTAPAGSWPWLAFIDDQLGPDDEELCSGTVVAPNLVLTAAHCAEDLSTSPATVDDPSNFTVITGSLDRTDAATSQVSQVTQLATHAAFTETTTSGGVTVIGDAALLVLATPTTAPPITLANSTDVAVTQPGVLAYVAGWGLTDPLDQSSLPDVLQSAPTVVQSAQYCEAHSPYFSSVAQVCTVDAPTYATSICGGDSGGPLVAEMPNSTWVQIGITSTDTNDCDTAEPDTFTSVAYVDPWVQSWITAEAGSTQPPTTTTPPPTVTPTPPPATPAATAVGRYTGASSQPHGHVNVSVGAKGITRLALQFNLRCSRGEHLRVGYTETAVDTTDPVKLVAANGVWTFTTRYVDTAGNHYSLTGTFPTASSATGTLSIVMHNHVCSTGLVHWAASLPSTRPVASKLSRTARSSMSLATAPPARRRGRPA
jgi:trypsin